MTDPKKAAQKKKRDGIIVAVLLLIFAVTFAKNVLLRKKGPSSQATTAVAGGNGSQAMTDQLIEATRLRSHEILKAEQNKVWEKEWGRDPYVALATLSTIAKAVNLTLDGILWDEVKPKAIVNGKTLYNNDTIYGYTVIEIKHRSVVLKTGEKTIELRVFGPVAGESA